MAETKKEREARVAAKPKPRRKVEANAKPDARPDVNIRKAAVERADAIASDLDGVREAILGIDPQELGDGRVMVWLNAIERDIRGLKQARMWPMAGDHFNEEGM